ncbi:MAG: hypothetical protein HFG75_11810 [Hungatella sp.]|nr:hypothetical protein [Hungatella sp.]
MKRLMMTLFLSAVLAGAGTFGAFGAHLGEWELTDDGKYWQYLYSWDDPAKDEWIEDEGKTYYLDSKGYMKTGWVSNKDDGKKYYMGPDGAMCFNTFASDGRYVGPEGTGLEAYDKYRKAIRARLKKSAPKKTKTTGRKTETSSEQNQAQQFFLMTDLNMDGYPDLIVMEGVQGPESLREVAVWIPEDQKFELSAEFDAPEHGERSTLYLDPEGEEVWLEMTEPSGEWRLFRMEQGSSRLESVWSFTLKDDEKGRLCYYINGDMDDREYWELTMARAKQELTGIPITGYLPATEENLGIWVDRILSEEEAGLWE